MIDGAPCKLADVSAVAHSTDLPSESAMAVIRIDLRHVGAITLCLVVTPLQAQVPLNDSQQREMLLAHNQWRAEAGVPPLRWSAELGRSSLAWATQLATQNACVMQHSRSRDDTGENLYWASPVMWSDGRREVQGITPWNVVDSWGREVADYDYADNRCQPGKQCGHYTQLVWQNTREVGCAAYVCPSKEQVWVCQYRPAGNYVGQRPY